MGSPRDLTARQFTKTDALTCKNGAARGPADRAQPAGSFASQRHRGFPYIAAVAFQCDRCGAWLEIPHGATPKILTTGGLKTPAARVVRVGNTNLHRCEIAQPEQSPAN
jgi:hypothetical protein